MEAFGETQASSSNTSTRRTQRHCSSEELRSLCLSSAKIFLKHKPVALFVVIGGIIAASTLSLETHGVKLIGVVPQGIPPLKVPSLFWRDLNQLLPLALACFLLGVVETAAIGRMFAAKHGGRFDANQENLALAASNLFAGLGGGLPVSGGTSQSLVNEEGGAKTPLSTALAAVFILVVVLFFSRLLSALPQPVLAAVVLVAIAGLLNLSTLKELWLNDRSEFVVAMAAFAGVLTFGLLRGVMLGALISLVQLVRVSSRPHVALLGRIPGTRRFSDCDRHADNELIPGVMIFRPESALVYFNVDNVCDAILNRVRAEPTLPKLVMLDLSAAALVDMQSAYALASMADELTAEGIQFHAVEPRSSVRDRLRHEHVDSKLGGIDRFTTVADVIDHFLGESEPSAVAIKSRSRSTNSSQRRKWSRLRGDCHTACVYRVQDQGLSRSLLSSSADLPPTMGLCRSRANTTILCRHRGSKEQSRPPLLMRGKRWHRDFR